MPAFSWGRGHKISVHIHAVPNVVKKRVSKLLLANRVRYHDDTFSHVKDKNDMFTVRGEDMIFSKRKNPGISSVSIE